MEFANFITQTEWRKDLTLLHLRVNKLTENIFFLHFLQMVVGTDISELLLKNKTEFPYEGGVKSSMSSLHSRRNSNDSERNQRYNQDASDESNDVDDSDEKKSLSEIEITEKFRNYLLYGNVNEALEWATDHNLWGHALFLASKVDRRSHANVMMKFANKLALNDPLQTLYQLMSGRTPSSVTVSLVTNLSIEIPIFQFECFIERSRR